jgi:hypothetical protein
MRKAACDGPRGALRRLDAQNELLARMLDMADYTCVFQEDRAAV